MQVLSHNHQGGDRALLQACAHRITNLPPKPTVPSCALGLQICFWAPSLCQGGAQHE